MNSATALNLCFASWLGSWLGFAGDYLRPAGAWRRLGRTALGLGWACLSAALALRWREAGRPPLSDMYESLLALAWGLEGLVLVLRRRIRILGLEFWAAGLGLGVLALASLMDRSIQPLVPALQSNWLVFHVVVIMTGYACLGLAALAGAVLLAGHAPGRGAEMPGGKEKAASLDAFSMRAVHLGFVLLLACIALGSVWADQAWGSYWSWDPKETWSLLTWLYYAVVIHLWRARGWRGVRLAWLNVGGSVLVGFTYFGVNYLLAGMHSYAR